MIDIGGMLSILYGNGTATGGTTLSSNPVTALSIAENIETKSVANEAKQPQVARDLAAFNKAVASAKTPAQLLKNPAVLKVLLTVNNLADQVGYPALAQKALLSDPAQSSALANQLGGVNKSWLTATKAYSFATKGLTVIQDPKTLASIASSYAQQTWLTSLDQATPGLSKALNFRSRASSITSVDQILGDSTLRTVVTTALGLPLEIANQQLPAQEQAISSRLNIKDFKSPSFVESFTQRYLLAASANAASSGTSTQMDLTSLAEQASLVV